jgi:hypothetical protein
MPSGSEPKDLLPSGVERSTPNPDGTTHQVIVDRDRQSHISWDTDKDGQYITGSGHETDDRGKPKERSSWFTTQEERDRDEREKKR